MSQPIIFLDIDGTISDHDKNIPKATKDAVNQLHKNGASVVIATGRAPFMFQDIMQELQIHSYISFNGQYVVYKGKVVHDHPLPVEQLQKLQDYSLKQNDPIVYQSVNTMKSTVTYHRYIEESMKSLKRDHPEYDDSFYRSQPIYQALIFNEDKEEAYEKQFEQMRFVRWHEYSCDVLPAVGSKAYGIEQFINNLGLDWKDTYAFGDGLNDQEMLEKVNVGVAMGNSVEPLKVKADAVTDDVSANGLANGLKKLKLI
ncbi:Cof-like hydrolase [Gracilibacillus halophilus YIM-C55.5]|uniref:Cof-like hydrolase n=1 Tax=Gracilibacillus halophilus YIM-C55.5 TaxID=1308866 RepID=N4WD68_9BACI|nr:Cof-type HAD-IIB family hydrolase [Gracilibacillus halophilus]ENH97214.1 Cof-like hydrolase [Gracilibacillus halophilus YIM-C55.5]